MRKTNLTGIVKMCRISTADVIWSYCWLAAQTQRYKQVLEILEIDMSRAFDTIHRDRLMEVLKTFLDEDELHLIRLLLSGTSLEARVNGSKPIPFSTTIGTPQGDGLSPVLFIVYLAAALRDL